MQTKLCGDTDIGGYPIRQMICDRPAGHDGWHNESKSGAGWMPKTKPEIRACVECGEEAPESGTICNECLEARLHN